MTPELLTPVASYDDRLDALRSGQRVDAQQPDAHDHGGGEVEGQEAPVDHPSDLPPLLHYGAMAHATVKLRADGLSQILDGLDRLVNRPFKLTTLLSC